MKKNGDYKVGATYFTQVSDDTYGIIFAVTISANATEKELKAALYAAAITADEIEKELLGSDNF